MSSLSSTDEYTDAMAREHANDSPVDTSYAKPSKTAVNGKCVMIHDNKDYLVVPLSSEVSFTMLVIHEWWGLNDQIKSMADIFAGMGGAALAVDLYQQEEPATVPREARQLMKDAMTNQSSLLEHLQDACKYLEEEFPGVKRGVVGWCFGGTFSLQVSLRYPMDGTIIYYGSLESEIGFGSLQGPILGIFGGQDRSISAEKVKAFDDELQNAGKEHEIWIYPDADHAFANPSSKLFNEEAAKAAWEKVVSFVEKNLMIK